MLEKIAGSTAMQAGPDAVVADMVRSIQALQGRLGAADLAGVGIGVPGFINMETGSHRRLGAEPQLQRLSHARSHRARPGRRR